MTKPLFVSFEGIDGAGKTTQIRLLTERLRATGREVVESVEPGSTRIATEIRRILLDPDNREMSPTAELLLYFAARAQNVDQVLMPALKRGAIVVSDRFTDSTLAYQGVARGLGEDVVRELERIACRGITPGITVFLDIDTTVGASRRQSADRLENESEAFHAKVRQAYLSIAEREPGRFHRVDGSRTPAIVADEVWRIVEPHV